MCVKLINKEFNLRYLLLTFFFITVGITMSTFANNSIVILKLDDIHYVSSEESTGVATPWRDVYEYLKSENLVAGFGMITKYSVDATPAHIAYIKQLIKDGFEIWHHGWDHSRGNECGEFCGYSYDYQKEHFDNAMNIVKEKYGYTMHSLGTPFNAMDSTFQKIIQGQSDIKVYMYPDYKYKPSNTLNLSRTINMENGVGNPDFAYFKSAYESKKGLDYYVLQGHPEMWGKKGTAKFNEFVKIVKYLKDAGLKFMTPYKYYQYVNGITKTSNKFINSTSNKLSIKQDTHGNIIINTQSKLNTVIISTPQGQTIARIKNHRNNRYIWKNTNIASGIYIFTIVTDNNTFTKQYTVRNKNY